MLSNLPLERRQHHELPNPQHSLVIRSYLSNFLEEIAEIRNTIKSLSPFLRNSQQNVQHKVFAYARNYTPYGRRARLRRSGKNDDSNDNDDTNNKKSFFRRVLNRILDVIAPTLGPTEKKQLNDRKKIKEEFQNFYIVNGISVRSHLTQMMARCKRMEMLLSNLKRKLKSLSLHENENDGLAGIAYQLRVHRGYLINWKRDFEYVWAQARNVRKLFGLVPAHNCWEVSKKYSLFIVVHKNT